MKAIYYVSVLFLILFTLGCKSLETLIDDDKDKEAIVISIQKLAKKKSIKTKDITSLEEAFEEINDSNLSKINTLTKRVNNGEGQLWEKIYAYATQIDTRQTQIAPHLPIVSKSGYGGKFKFIDALEIRQEASDRALAYIYKSGTDSLTYALKNQDKNAAQQAYYILKRGEVFPDKYENLSELIEVSKKAATYKILLLIDQETIPGEFDLIVNTKKAIGEPKPWIEYYADPSDEVTFDYIATIAIDEIYVSSESEEVEDYFVQRTRPINQQQDNQENNPQDSLGNSTGPYQNQRETVRAPRQKITRTKECQVSASIEFKDFLNRSSMSKRSFLYNEKFESIGGSTNGDFQSLLISDEQDKKLEPFPLDIDMTMEGINELSKKIFKHLSKIDSEDLRHDLIVLN